MIFPAVPPLQGSLICLDALPPQLPLWATFGTVPPGLSAGQLLQACWEDRVFLSPCGCGARNLLKSPWEIGVESCKHFHQKCSSRRPGLRFQRCPACSSVGHPFVSKR